MEFTRKIHHRIFGILRVLHCKVARRRKKEKKKRQSKALCKDRMGSRTHACVGESITVGSVLRTLRQKCRRRHFAGFFIAKLLVAEKRRDRAKLCARIGWD